MRGTYAYDGLQRCKKMANNALPSPPHCHISITAKDSAATTREEETRAFFTYHHRHVYPSVSPRARAPSRKDEIAGKKVIEY